MITHLRFALDVLYVALRRLTERMSGGVPAERLHRCSVAYMREERAT